MQHLVVRVLYDDVLGPWNLCYLYYFSGSFWLGHIRGLGSCIGIHYLDLNYWLAWLNLLERNWIYVVGRPIGGDRDMVSVVQYTCPQARGWLIWRVFIRDWCDNWTFWCLTWQQVALWRVMWCALMMGFLGAIVMWFQ